ncbi:MAG: autotransporter outer membrane beta-barrel domain-containing protein, partial [Cetobacterium sp.]
IIDTLNLDDIINRPDDKEKPDNKGEEKPDNPPDNEVEDREDLGDIWDSIVNGGEEDYLAPTLDYEDGKNIVEAKKELISILDQIYANNPYSYIGEASKESLRLYQDNIFTTKMPKKDEWITEAHGIYGYDKFEKAEQNNRFGKEIQKNSYSSNVSTYGMLGTAEYGILEDTSLGIAIGGSKQKVDMSKGTKIDGNSGYIGVYGKKNINRFRITSGIGYQHNEYDVDRILINKYQEFKNNGSLSTDSIGVYLEGKYFIKSETGVSIEPKLRLSYMNISQEEVKEKSNELAIDVDGKNYQNTDILIGVDFSKKKYLKGGLLEFKGELSYMKTLDTERDYLTGRIKNSTSFKIKGPEITEDRIRIIVGIDYEKVNGV